MAGIGVQVRPYQEDEVVLIVGREHPLAGGPEIDRKTLASLKFVSLHRSSTVQGIKSTLEQHGIDWKTLQVVMVGPDHPLHPSKLQCSWNCHHQGRLRVPFSQ